MQATYTRPRLGCCRKGRNQIIYTREPHGSPPEGYFKKCREKHSNGYEKGGGYSLVRDRVGPCSSIFLAQDDNKKIVRPLSSWPVRLPKERIQPLSSRPVVVELHVDVWRSLFRQRGRISDDGAVPHNEIVTPPCVFLGISAETPRGIYPTSMSTLPRRVFCCSRF